MMTLLLVQKSLFFSLREVIREWLELMAEKV
jgi:hypothetical protein